MSTVSVLNSQAVDRGGVDLRGQRAVVALPPVGLLPDALLLVGQRVVVDAVAREAEIDLEHARRHEKAVPDRRLELVGVGRHARLELEQVVGVPVDLLARRGGQPDEERVEVLEDLPVLPVHRAVRLVDDDQVEVADVEARRAVLGPVDQPHHRRVGADVDPPVRVLVGHEVDRARVGQLRLERVGRLADERLPVGEEQRALDPPPPAAGRRRARSPCASCRCRSP